MTKNGRPRSDALVFFGATGDLAYKKIFPALQSMAGRGRLDFPVVGVARSGWTREQFIEHARASVTEYGGLVEASFAHLAANLRYVDGDYNDPATFAALRIELAAAERSWLLLDLAAARHLPAAPRGDTPVRSIIR